MHTHIQIIISRAAYRSVWDIRDLASKGVNKFICQGDREGGGGMLVGRPVGHPVLSNGPAKLCGPFLNESIVGMDAVIEFMPLKYIIITLGFGPQHRPRDVRGIHIVPKV